MLLTLLYLSISLLSGLSIGVLWGWGWGGLVAGLLLFASWKIEKLLRVQIRIGQWSLAILAPVVWVLAGAFSIGQWLQATQIRERTPQIAPLTRDVEATANVDRSSMQVEKDKLTYTLTVRYREGLKIQIPKIEADPTFNGPFIMPNPPQILDYPPKDGVVVKRWILSLIAVAAGPLDTPSFEIRYRKDDQTHKVIVPRIAVEVGEIAKPAQLLANLKASKPPVLPEIPTNPYIWLWWLLLATSLALGVGVAIAISRRQAYQPPPLPPHKWFEQEFQKLQRQKLLAKAEYKAHYFALSEILRGYLERRFAFPALESTTEEICQWSKGQDLRSELALDLRKALQVMDSVKFGGYRPEYEENEDLTQRTCAIVEQTKLVTEPNNSRTQGNAAK
jgi:hypothetical protein